MSLSIEELETIIKECYEAAFEVDPEEGKVADYIPQLQKVNPDLYGVSFCDINGRMFKCGDTSHLFSLQSMSKPLAYCLARVLEEEQDTDVHKHVGYEPSGRAFNEFVLNGDGLPHNPLINSGAIMVASLIRPQKEPAHRYETIMNFFSKMAGHNQGK
jgi:glutaminase